MFLAVAVPLLQGTRFPESPSARIMAVFNTIEKLPEGSRVLLSFDYDPASQGELAPMAAAFTRHCCEKQLKLYYMTLWESGPPMVQINLDIVKNEYPDYKYGTDYVHLGFKSGTIGVIKNMGTSIRKDFSTDHFGTSLDQLPLTRDLKNLEDFDLLICVGAGSPGPRDWVQYAAAPYGITMLAGATGVQAPELYPYIPRQLKGLLAAIKSAAEYEQSLIVAYPKFADRDNAKEGLRRMGPQLVAHVLMVSLILLGNIVYFLSRREQRA